MQYRGAEEEEDSDEEEVEDEAPPEKKKRDKEMEDYSSILDNDLEDDEDNQICDKVAIEGRN